MIYDCLIHTEEKRLVAARRNGHAWSLRERMDPFEIVTVELPEDATANYSVILNSSVGDIETTAGEIDSRLYIEDALLAFEESIHA